MKFLYSLLLLIGISCQESYAATQLNGFGTVTYEDDHGFPTNIRIGFDSDFTANVQASAGPDEVYFTYDLSGSGSGYYSDNSLVINNAGPGTGELMISLTKSGVPPDVGVYEITVALDMIYKNTAGDILMHYKTYTITVNLKGVATTYSLSTAGGVATSSFTETINNDATNADTMESVVPGDLGLSQDGGTVSFGSDIVLISETADPDYKVWFDTGVPINVFNDNSYSEPAKVYEWPIALVSASSDEGSATNSLTITLKSVPVDLFNLNTIYIQLNVKFRDTAGDEVRRTLRLSPSSSRNLERKEESSTQVSTAFKFESAGSDASTIITKTLWAISSTLLVGTALLL